MWSEWGQANLPERGEKPSLRALAKDLCLHDVTVRSNAGGIAVSGECCLYGMWENNGIFIEISQSCYSWVGPVLYRTNPERPRPQGRAQPVSEFERFEKRAPTMRSWSVFPPCGRGTAVSGPLEERDEQQFYASERLKDCQHMILRMAQSLVVQRARVEKARSAGLAAARDAYSDLQEVRGYLLEALSDTHRGKRETLAALRRRQGRTGEAWTLLERELFDHAHGLQTVLLKMIEWALEEGDWAYARLLSDRAEQAGACLDLSDYAVLSAPLQLALAEQDGPQAIRLLERMLRSLASPWDLSESPLYRHLLTKDAAGEAQTPLISLLLDEVSGPYALCAFLWELPEYRALLQRWRTP